MADPSTNNGATLDRPLERTEAATTAGRISGRMQDGVHVFKGVRYGADTAPPFRFMPPRPAQPWTGVVDALEYGASCPQGTGSEGGRLYVSRANPRPMSEDCLFLNVWSGGLRDGGKRPVMVWFHGGGYIAGSGSRLDYDGRALVKRGDVVVVTVNHRLNVFGYTYLDGLGDPDFADTANVGNRDLVLALQWVRDNIEEFGGDPGNVTIFGVSGGGSKVLMLMATPSATGLYHKAIAQSTGLQAVQTPEQATEVAIEVLQRYGLGPKQAKALQALPADAIVAKLRRVDYGLAPLMDGTIVPRQPWEPDAPPFSKSIPLMTGTCRHETSSLSVGRDNPALFEINWADLPGAVDHYLQGRTVDGGGLVKVKAGLTAATIIADYRAAHPRATPAEIFILVSTAVRFRQRTTLRTERKAAQGGAPVFSYIQTWESPVDGGRYRASHGSDTPLVFDNVAVASSLVGDDVEGAQKTSNAMSVAWLRFAKTGDPGWPAFTATRRATMLFGPTSRVVDDPFPEERRLFD